MSGKVLRTLQVGNDWFGERESGLNRFYSELLKHLPEVGVEVHGMVVGSSNVRTATGGRIESFASAKDSVARRFLGARREAIRFLRAQKPDLIASHFAMYAFPFLDYLRLTPTVIHFHGPWAAETFAEGRSSWSAKARAAIERAVYGRGSRVIVLSKAFGTELVRRYGVPEERVRLVPGGIDCERFNDQLTRQQARERLGWPNDRPIVLSVRRLKRRMGLENLIDAAKQVSRMMPDVLILLGGTGPIADELQARIAEHGLNKTVRLLGRVDDADLPAAYRAADVSIVPSQSLEGFGLITLESLACGTPVLVTPVGGLPEVVQPFAPQCVLSGSSAEIIAEALQEFLLGKQMLPGSEECRNYAQGKFSWPVIARLTRGVYEEALA